MFQNLTEIFKQKSHLDTNLLKLTVQKLTHLNRTILSHKKCLCTHNPISSMISYIVIHPQVPKTIDPGICAYDCSILKSPLLPELSIFSLILEESVGSFVCLDVIITAAWSSPIGIRKVNYLKMEVKMFMINASGIDSFWRSFKMAIKNISDIF